MSDVDTSAREAAIAAIEEGRRLPTLPEVKVLLERYFEGPITDAVVARLHQEMASIKADNARHDAEVSSYNANNVRARGYAWLEDFSRGTHLAREKDLALFHAATTRGYPKAKLYCPDYFVGWWGHTDDSGREIRWRFEANGEFETSLLSAMDAHQWCVKRSARAKDAFVHSDIAVRESPQHGWHHFTILESSENSLVLMESVYEGVAHHRLTRVEGSPTTSDDVEAARRRAISTLEERAKIAGASAGPSNVQRWVERAFNDAVSVLRDYAPQVGESRRNYLSRLAAAVKNRRHSGPVADDEGWYSNATDEASNLIIGDGG